MRVAVIGGTGRIGSKVVAEALARGHEVTVIARDPSRGAHRPGLRFVAMDVNAGARFSELLRRNDAVVSAFNPGWTSPRLYDEYLRGTKAILSALRGSSPPRLLFVGSAGSLEVSAGVQYVDTSEFPSEGKAGALAAREALHLMRKETGVVWTYLSPPYHVEDGPRTAMYRTGRDTPITGAGRRSYISVPDLAVAIVDELERPQHLGQRFTVGY